MKAHDVRRLHLCGGCGQLGAHGANLASRLDAPLVVHVGTHYMHPRCMRPAALLALPRVELDEVRLCDVPPRVMRRLLAAIATVRL